MKVFSHPFVVILIGTLFICQAAFYNGFPLVYSDTGTYIFSGQEMSIPIDRPILYGLFIKFTSFGFSLWSTIFFQALLASYLLYKIILTFFSKGTTIIFLSFVFILSFLSGLSWYTSQLMPDIFTAFSILAFYLLIMSKNANKREQFLLLFIFVLTVNVHYSNFLIALFLMLFLGVLYNFNKLKYLKQHFALKPILIAFIISFITPFIINYSVGKTTKVNQGSQVFLIARMLDNGVLKSFLDDNCKDNNYSLCSCKDNLPVDSRAFLWSSESPLYAIGGWNDSEIELNKIIRDILISPKHLSLFLYTSITSTVSQLFQNEIGSGLISDWYASTDSPPYYAIASHFPRELKQYEQARQNTNLWGQKLDFSTVNYWNSILLFLSAILLLFFLISKRLWGMLDSKTKLFIGIIFLGILFNAFITGSLANVYDRLQARVSWLLILTALIVAASQFKSSWILLKHLYTKHLN